MDVERSLIELRRECLRLANKSGDGNLQSVFSSLEILWCLYDRILSIDEIIKKSVNRDFFLCSKGQATLGLLCVLATKGIIPESELDSYGQFHSRISMQADRTKFDSGVEISAGSLGHGLPMGAGIALSKKIRNRNGRVYVLVGDGEMHEGTNWEACAFIGSRNLSNVCIIVDDNASHDYMFHGGLEERLRAFSIHVVQCDGHDVGGLEETLKKTQNITKPVAIVAKTRRGYGSKTLMTKREWFHKAPNDDELETMLRELEEFDPMEAKGYILSE